MPSVCQIYLFFLNSSLSSSSVHDLNDIMNVGFALFILVYDINGLLILSLKSHLLFHNNQYVLLYFVMLNDYGCKLKWKFPCFNRWCSYSPLLHSPSMRSMLQLWHLSQRRRKKFSDWSSLCWSTPFTFFSVGREGVYTYLQQEHSLGCFTYFKKCFVCLDLTETGYLMRYSHPSYLVAIQIQVLHLPQIKMFYLTNKIIF